MQKTQAEIGGLRCSYTNGSKGGKRQVLKDFRIKLC